jgi:hypothetical protein
MLVSVGGDSLNESEFCMPSKNPFGFSVSGAATSMYWRRMYWHAWRSGRTLRLPLSSSASAVASAGARACWQLGNPCRKRRHDVRALHRQDT